jgi:hypothetical protein
LSFKESFFKVRVIEGDHGSEPDKGKKEVRRNNVTDTFSHATFKKNLFRFYKKVLK